MIRKILAYTTVAASLLMGSVSAQAQEDQTFNAKQTDAIRKIVREYLIEHPETITEAVEALREKMRAQAEAEALKGIESRKDELFNGKEDPVLGNAAGDVVIVEFFDYNCPYCKVSLDPMLEAAKADGKVKVVFKEMPILSEDSITAARVALAAKKQGKYEDVHRAFMKYRGKLDEKTIYRLAGEAGANVELLRKESLGTDIDKQIRKSTELAHALGVSSTPTFILADAKGGAARIISSALEASSFRQLIDITRKGGRLSQ